MPPSTSTSISNPTTSLTTQKSTFLTHQILLLSTPLTITTTSPLPEPLTTPLLTKLNKRITSHNRLAFPLQSQRHVLEQVEGVYWRDVLSEGLPVGKCETLVRRDVDFTGADAVVRGWEDVVCEGGDGEEEQEQEQGRDRARKRRRVDGDTRGEQEHDHEGPEPNSSSEAPSQPHHFQTLQTNITQKLHHRTTLRRRLHALNRLKAKLEPFKDPQPNVQPNLMWKGNREVESEIARMRVLLVRCAGVGRGGRGEMGEEGKGDVQTQTQTQRIEALLGLA